MLIILSEVTVKLEDFSAFKVVESVWGYDVRGLYLGEWIQLYSSESKVDTQRIKDMIDEGIKLVESCEVVGACDCNEQCEPENCKCK